MTGTSFDTTYRILQYCNSGAFFLLGVLALADWLRARRRTRLWLAIALGSLGLVGLSSILLRVANLTNSVLEVGVILLLLVSGGALVQFRSEIVPYHRITRAAYGLLLGASALAVAILGVPGSSSSCLGGQVSGQHPAQYAATLAAVVVWLICLVEPPLTLARAASHLPSVQRGRLRYLSAGYGTIVVVVLLSIPTAGCHATLAQVGIECLSFAAVPLLFLSFQPPAWLRQRWRRVEQEQLREAMGDLLLFSPTREIMAERALPWAIRLVGGEAGAIISGQGEILARFGELSPKAIELLDDRSMLMQPAMVPFSSQRQALIRPLNLNSGTGALVVIGGTLSPQFEFEEVEILSAYSVSITIAMDRVALFEEMAAKEKELQQARDTAQSANIAKSEFLSRMSHELRTPLTAMLGFAELLDLEELTPEQHRYTQTMVRAGSHLLELINDILDVSRIEEGRISLVPEPIRVVDVVREAIELVGAAAVAQEVHLAAEVSEKIVVMADRQRFRQILVNLLSNGIKYNHRGGSVDVTIRNGAEHSAQILIQDTGPGLSGDDLKHVFEPFERLWAQRSGVEGTGLGLALSKTLAEAMRGSIGVSSSLGNGSTFWVELPIADGRYVASMYDGDDPVDVVSMSAGAPTVLYVEDTESNVRLVEGIFRRRPGVRLLVAADGAQGLELAKKSSPDLILLDLHLPDINGDELLRLLREDPAMATTPVMIVSADGTSGQRQRLLEAGAQEYVTKPIHIHRFLQLVDSYLAKVPARR